MSFLKRVIENVATGIVAGAVARPTERAAKAVATATKAYYDKRVKPLLQPKPVEIPTDADTSEAVEVSDQTSDALKEMKKRSDRKKGSGQKKL